MLLPDYPAFLAALKDRVHHARISAARSVNRELILLYWDIGRGIADKQKIAGWGDAVVERLAADLRAEFPNMRGFSEVNLWRMKQLYLVHTSPGFLSQAVKELKLGEGDPGKLSQAVRDAVMELVASIPWGHHANLLAKLTDPAARLYYLRATAQFGWSRNVLLNQIKAGAYERAVKEKKTHNFPLALPEHLAILYGVETGALNRAVKRNIDRFPDDFMFQLGSEDSENLKCLIGISSSPATAANSKDRNSSQSVMSSKNGRPMRSQIVTAG